MNWLKRKRIKQVMQYGWQDAKVIAPIAGKSRLTIWFDIIGCFKKYYLFSNQYKSKEVWKLSIDETQHLAKSLGDKNRYRDDWTVWKYENAAFIDKYSSVKYGTNPRLYKERLVEYKKRYNIGDGTIVSNNVIIERNHFLEGSIKIGKDCTLSKNVYIDYSGDLCIEDGVKLANGVIIETHHRDLEAMLQGKDVNIPTKLLIRKNTLIGARAIILDSCNYIGINSRIGAGAVVNKDVPDNTVVAGVPGKVVKYLEQQEKEEK